MRERRRYPDFECEFTHGLLQEVALATLAATARRELYGRIAAAYEELYQGSLDEHLERLAHYHAQTGNSRKRLSTPSARERPHVSTDNLIYLIRSIRGEAHGNRNRTELLRRPEPRGGG